MPTGAPGWGMRGWPPGASARHYRAPGGSVGCCQVRGLDRRPLGRACPSCLPAEVGGVRAEDFLVAWVVGVAVVGVAAGYLFGEVWAGLVGSEPGPERGVLNVGFC